MATIKRPIKVYNGNAWDEILPTTSADQVKELNPIVIGKRTSIQSFGNADGEMLLQTIETHGTTENIATLNSGKIKINKAGRYIVSYDAMFRSNAETGATGIYTVLKVINGSSEQRFETVDGGYWSGRCGAKSTRVLQLKVGDTLSVGCNIYGNLSNLIAYNLYLVKLGD